MTAYVPKEVRETLPGPGAPVGSDGTSWDVSSELVNKATAGTSPGEETPTRTEGGPKESKQNKEGLPGTSAIRNETDGELAEYNVEDNLDPNAHPSPAEMLHFLGGPRAEDASYVLGSNPDLTKERLRQFATARLAEQGRRVMQEANFLFQQEAAAAMQRNVSATVASKPLYPIAAPQRMKLPKHPVRFADHRCNPNKQYDGPLNLVNRPVQSGRHYAAIRPPLEDCVVDLSKPLDLSMKSIERQRAVSRAPPVMDPRLISMSMANSGTMVGKSHGLSSNGRGVTSAVTTTQSVYRPPPMMSFSKPGRRGNLVYSTPSTPQQHPLLAKDMPQISQGQLHPMISTTVAQHIQPSRTALKRPAPVLVHSASGIPTKRTVHEKSLAKEFSKVTPSSSVPMSANMQSYEATRAAYLAYERDRSHAASLITQQNKSSSLRITDVRSTARVGGIHPVPTSTASRPRTKARGTPIFHHIHHHLHHHHVPQQDEELLLSDSNGTNAVQVPSHPEVPSHTGVLTHENVLPKNGRPLPVREIQIHRLANHGLSSHDMKAHDIVTEPNLAASRRDRAHGVLIKHTTGTPTAAVTSPHLKRAHYRTRRRYRSISPPTLVSISGIPTLSRDAPSVVSTPGRPHQPNRAASPLRLVASSFAAGAKMNEILKPLDGPDQPTQGVNKNLARPLRVDIPDDRAFVSHLGGVYTGQANPVPLVRQVANVANITKCLTSEASSSPKKANSSGNESPTMPVLTPQSVYSPCPLPPSFTSDSAATSHLHQSSTAADHTSASSSVFYNALTLPLYPLNKDASTEVAQKISRLKNNSPPNLQEKSPEQQVPDQRVPDNIDPDQVDSDPDPIAAYRERNRVNNVLQREIDKYILDAASKVDQSKQMQRRYHDRGGDYGREYSRETLEDIDKGRKGHMHQYSLKASLDKLKSKQPKKEKHLSHVSRDSDDRNIFAQFKLQRQWCGAKTKAKLPTTKNAEQLQQCDVIDLTTSPSLSPAPDILKSNTGTNGVSGGIPEKKSETPPPAFRSQTTKESMLKRAILEGKSVSVSDAIDAAFAGHLRDFSCVVGSTEHQEYTFKKQSIQPDLKDSLRRLSENQTSQSISPAVPSSFGNTCAVITSAKTSSMVSSAHTSEDVLKHGVLPQYSSSLSAHSSPSFFNGSISLENLQSSVSPCRTGGALSTSAMTSSTPSLSQMRYSPTEKTFSHDPRKKLLAAMSFVHMPPGVACSISPVSVAASLNSTVSPSSGRSTPSKSSARKRSLEMIRLENTSSYVAEIPKRRGHVDLLTDPSLLDREERALQRAMKRFNEMEQKEKLTPTDSQSNPQTDPQTQSRRHGRVLNSKQSPTFRSGRGRGRKIRRLMRIQQKFKDDFSVSALKARQSFSREMRRLTSTISRPSFHDFVPTVLEDRTRHSLATRSSARERKAPYHKNARYEMEIEKEERKYLERKRHKRSVSRSTSGDDEPNSPKTKMPPGRRRKGSENVFKVSADKTVVVKEEPLTEINEEVKQTNEIETKPDPAQLDDLPTEEGAAKPSSMDMDTPLHVVLDPTNRIKMKFMTPSAYEMHQKDSGKENDSGKKTESVKKPGGKRKYKTKNVSSAVVSMETDVQQEENIKIKTEVSEIRTETPPPLPEPIPVKIVRPNPPFELKRLMVNKKLGETVLHRAARLAYDDVAIYCIDYDVVDINAKDNAGYTPLHECCVHGRLSVARYLLEHGADVNASASDGTRPIHDAVDNNWLELVRMLLAYGADPLIATYSGRTTIKLARTKAMKTFIIGYLRDVNGDWELDEEDPCQSNLDVNWSLDREYSFDEKGNATVDIFQDVPEERKDKEDNFLLELSDTPHLTTYNIRLANTQRARNWLLLSDVTRQLNTSRMEFLACNRTLRRATMTRHDFTVATEHSQLNRAPSSLEKTSRNSTVELLELSSELRTILHIEEEYI